MKLKRAREGLHVEVGAEAASVSQESDTDQAEVSAEGLRPALHMREAELMLLCLRALRLETTSAPVFHTLLPPP